MNVHLWELSIVNANFIRAEHCECEIMRAEHIECEFYESCALSIWIFWELSIVDWGPPYPQGVEQVNIRRKKWKKRGMWNLVEWADFFVECPKIFVESYSYCQKSSNLQSQKLVIFPHVPKHNVWDSFACPHSDLYCVCLFWFHGHTHECRIFFRWRWNIPKQNIIGKQAQNYVTAIMQCYYSDDKSLFGYFNLFGRFSFL